MQVPDPPSFPCIFTGNKFWIHMKNGSTERRRTVDYDDVTYLAFDARISRL